ncbi:MAG TPA: PQQ-binding-like beta-propeller repeat protein [Bryobacteraceae bacterium]|jgi:polyvinyl alcohol dehydrogenase (cytochrome)
MRRLISALLLAAAATSAQDAADLFAKHCGACHRSASDVRAPLPDVLALMPRQQILTALESGSMKAQGEALTREQRVALAAFLSKITTIDSAANGLCSSNVTPARGQGAWNGWGVDLANTRFQPASGLSAQDIPKLQLKWAFGFPNATVAFAQPTIDKGKLYFGSGSGKVYSVDVRTGCIFWTFQAASGVRSAISIDGTRAFFGDLKANVYAIDIAAGKLAWQVHVEEHVSSRITGAPALYNGRLYVPVSSVEEPPAGNIAYSCCTFRGSVVALDAESGKQIWKSYAIPDPPGKTKTTATGTQLMGPAGAAIWSAPTIDPQRNVLYVATGNGYSDPATKYTDAIIAFDLATGSMKWSRQMTPNDRWNFGCQGKIIETCPPDPGGDYDFGASPVLIGNLLFAGQKSGMVHALDADRQGAVVWQTRIGRGSALGGVEWGLAADTDNVYAPLSDINGQGLPMGGLFALRQKDGAKVWHALPPKPPCAGKPGCSAAQMAPATAIPGIVFSGSMDGHLRAYEAATGKLVWDFDTLREFPTVNGVKAKGGSLNATGPTLAGGMLFVNSGYGSLGGMPGNVLLAFGL